MRIIRIITIMGIMLLVFLAFFIVTCKPAEYFPKEGIWYCSELDTQLDFYGDGNTFVIVDSEKICCECIVHRGSDDIFVICQEDDCELYYLGEKVFSMEFVSLDGNTLILKDLDGEGKYTFTRIS